jgi:hypothetical protein
MTEFLDGQPGCLGLGVGLFGDSPDVATQRAE